VTLTLNDKTALRVFYVSHTGLYYGPCAKFRAFRLWGQIACQQAVFGAAGWSRRSTSFYSRCVQCLSFTLIPGALVERQEIEGSWQSQCRPEISGADYALSLALRFHGGPSEVYELAYSFPYTYTYLQRNLHRLAPATSIATTNRIPGRCNQRSKTFLSRKLLCRTPQLRRVDLLVISDPMPLLPPQWTDEQFIAKLQHNEQDARPPYVGLLGKCWCAGVRLIIGRALCVKIEHDIAPNECCLSTNAGGKHLNLWFAYLIDRAHDTVSDVERELSERAQCHPFWCPHHRAKVR
jgi:hypothetical protein